jgi:hypothetical protein
MPHWLSAILGSALSVGILGTIVLWGSVWIRVEHWMRVVPTLRLGQRLAAVEPPSGSVCVVVPAYNEARVIAALVQSLRSESYPQLRVVLATIRRASPARRSGTTTGSKSSRSNPVPRTGRAKSTP